MTKQKQTDARARQQVRWFIGGWMRGRAGAPLTEIQAAALTRFASDATFVQAFWPIALGADPATTRALLTDPLAALVDDVLREMDRLQTSIFTFQGDHWVRRTIEELATGE